MVSYPKRLIEVDLPIREISAHARREKSIRHGHISTLHIWWARRPLAACRAVLCASLWPDPVDEACPQGFRDAAAVAICYFADQVQHDEKLALLCKNHWTRWIRTNPSTLRSNDPACWADMRCALLDFIADFANWDASTLPAFLDTARLLTKAAHLTLNEMWPIEKKDFPKTNTLDALNFLEVQIKDLPKPLVVDPFAGGGAIPLEALRVGADAFASDLNPVAVLLNKVVLEYIPKYGNARIETKDAEGNPIVLNGLADAVHYWGSWVRDQAEKELAEFYPSGPGEEVPIAFLWARTIICEGPGCGAEIPLLRSLWLARRDNHGIGLNLIVDKLRKRVDFQIIEKEGNKWSVMPAHSSSIHNPKFDGTVKKGSVTCPVCGYTTPVTKIKSQLSRNSGGTNSARLIAVRYDDNNNGKRTFRLANDIDVDAIKKARARFEQLTEIDGFALPNENLPPYGTLGFRIQPYGITRWIDLFTFRQALSLATFGKIIRTFGISDEENEITGYFEAVKVCMSLILDRLSDFNSSLCVLNSTGGRGVVHTFGRQALPMVWDFLETNPFNSAGANWMAGVDAFVETINAERLKEYQGHVELLSATSSALPDDSVHAFITDPPYYDAVPYADLSDYFYVWLKRTLPSSVRSWFESELSPKDDECIVDTVKGKDRAFFEATMSKAMSEGRRILVPNGIGIVVFAHKSTLGWEAQIQAMIDAGWAITGSWPIDTERPGRLRAQDSAALASSIHLVCRPRETMNGDLQKDVGDWRYVLSELPTRVHLWLPRLAGEGIVGADAIFACLGPALEIFSRYNRVEKASGEVVTLKEYLEVVWAAVSREAMSVIFEGADASGFEEDARLTAMWLWTLSGNKPENQPNGNDNTETEEADEETSTKTNGSGSHYMLEYDTARKIAQGLGAHLERLNSLVELTGDQARLLSVSERAGSLFGREENPMTNARKKAASSQLSLFSLMVSTDGSSAEDDWQEDRIKLGQTTLDQIHQAMLLFGAGRGTTLKRFLVDDGIGKTERFWRLAQALSALYPSSSEEKRWIDGVLAKKKGLGF